jgi:hypothetical protein
VISCSKKTPEKGRTNDSIAVNKKSVPKAPYIGYDFKINKTYEVVSGNYAPCFEVSNKTSGKTAYFAGQHLIATGKFNLLKLKAGNPSICIFSTSSGTAIYSVKTGKLVSHFPQKLIKNVTVHTGTYLVLQKKRNFLTLSYNGKPSIDIPGGILVKNNKDVKDVLQIRIPLKKRKQKFVFIRHGKVIHKTGVVNSVLFRRCGIFSNERLDSSNDIGSDNSTSTIKKDGKTIHKGINLSLEDVNCFNNTNANIIIRKLVVDGETEYFCRYIFNTKGNAFNNKEKSPCVKSIILPTVPTDAYFIGIGNWNVDLHEYKATFQTEATLLIVKGEKVKLQLENALWIKNSDCTVCGKNKKGLYQCLIQGKLFRETTKGISSSIGYCFMANQKVICINGRDKAYIVKTTAETELVPIQFSNGIWPGLKKLKQLVVLTLPKNGTKLRMNPLKNQISVKQEFNSSSEKPTPWTVIRSGKTTSLHSFFHDKLYPTKAIVENINKILYGKNKIIIRTETQVKFVHSEAEFFINDGKTEKSLGIEPKYRGGEYGDVLCLFKDEIYTCFNIKRLLE